MFFRNTSRARDNRGCSLQAVNKLAQRTSILVGWVGGRDGFPCIESFALGLVDTMFYLFYSVCIVIKEDFILVLFYFKQFNPIN